MSTVLELRTKPWAKYLLPGTILVAVALFPLFRPPLDGFMDDCIIALAYVVMALGLNLVVGFAGLLDLGYVAFYAFGAMVVGWWASDFFTGAGGAEDGIHFGVTGFANTLPGIHVNFLVLLIGAIIVCAIAGAIIGLPTLRLRGDYIAIVTLAFGEIIGRIFANGDEVTIFGDYKLSNGRQSISPIDPIDVPALAPFDSAINLRPYYWAIFALVLVVLFVNLRLRDSKLGRAWIALREDEVAAASMGVPLVKTKLLAYATGGAFGGIAGAFLGAYYASVNANSFQFGLSIFILAMVILGGLGSIWGVVIGAVALSFVNTRLIPDVLDQGFVGNKLRDAGLDFSFTEISFGVFGFILVIMMVLRPEGILPERRRQMELTEGIGSDESVFEARL
ncbi:MAG: branched-chain amino acid transport system permease protein [Thermoleophilaceae bacterium]|jgi:branched-chain amino acid transport system permease protein|nr:branched-chain amino acid transport system permease protein [Thermoleophilaceae bacterium]